MLPKLKIGDLEISIPIIQGGMGVGISLWKLASAVALTGAVGIIAAVQAGLMEKDFQKNPRKTTRFALAKYIKKAKKISKGGVVGVNIMVALQDFEELARISSEAGADLIISGAGLPLNLPGLVSEESSIKLVPIVSSARAAELICKKWGRNYSSFPDAVVVEGPKAGGHLGFKLEEIDSSNTRLEKIVPEVVGVLRKYEDKCGRAIPVVAAGGIYDGEDIYNALQLGVAGVQIGTRFVATHECDVSDEFKEAYLNATKDDIVIIKSPVGLPGRAIKSGFTNRIERGKTKPYRCVYKCIKTCNAKKAPYCISEALINAQRGNLEEGFVFCGSNVWRVDKIISVQELIDELMAGYETAVAKKT